jgi:peptidoglycan/xylan/chitin deacetylase (PgdA/CDA1 family)/ketosteroid isomerase-like protein
MDLHHPGTFRAGRGFPGLRRLLLCLACAGLTGLAAAGEGRALLVTVDDLPMALGSLHPEPAEREQITREMLAALERHRVPAVGLVTWRNVGGPEGLKLLRLWIEAGHELGNHSYAHLDYTRTGIDEYVADVERCREELAGFLEPYGKSVRFFRFPMLHEGNTPEKLDAMRDYLARTGQRNLPVTLDNQDWSYERPWVSARRDGDERAMRDVGEDYLAALRISIRHHERTGDRLFGRELPQILLLHANEVGAEHWDRLFTWLKETGHRFVSVDELLADPVFAETHEFVGPAGYGLWDRFASERRAAKAREEVTAHLDAQVAAWNRGDLESFCAGYEKDALFLTPKGVTRGRDEILERYRKSYSDREAMGTLSFEILEIRPAQGVEISMLGDSRPGRVHAVSVAARWTLSYRDREDSSGLTMLFLRRHGDGWAIAHDTSM